MKIQSYLQPERGITAIIGSGGKTTLMMTLARELSSLGRVIITTSTKLLRPDALPVLDGAEPDAVRSAANEHPILCVAAPFMGGKLTSPLCSFDMLAAIADYVLVEADGSHGQPFKAHRPWEPVIPENAVSTIHVIGADGFGRPISEVCHCPELFAALAQTSVNEAVTPAIAARVLLSENYGQRYFLNKVETEQDYRRAFTLSNYLHRPLVAGSLFREEYFIC